MRPRIAVGQKYHMLTVKEVLPKGRAIFTCECGNEKNIRYYNVTRTQNPTKSCGCYKSTMCIERNNLSKGRLTKPKGHSAITTILKRYKQGAKSRKLEFKLSREFVTDITAKPCYYCGTFGSLIQKTDAYSWEYNGIDRVDNSIGYIESNVVPCCEFCNRAKYRYSQEEFIEMCKKVTEHQKLFDKRK